VARIPEEPRRVVLGLTPRSDPFATDVYVEASQGADILYSRERPVRFAPPLLFSMALGACGGGRPPSRQAIAPDSRPNDPASSGVAHPPPACPDGTEWNGSACLAPTVCKDGRCLDMLASTPKPPGGIAVDGASVYFAVFGAGGTGTVMKVPLGGGAVTT